MQKEVEDLGVPPNSPYGHCGRKVTVKKVQMTSHDVPESFTTSLGAYQLLPLGTLCVYHVVK